MRMVHPRADGIDDVRIAQRHTQAAWKELSTRLSGLAGSGKLM
jgi:hypothetical protein